jgi:hypothetical protein
MSKESMNPYHPPESDLDIELPIADIVRYRKQLVPKWIKFFGWIFIILGVVAPLSYLASFSDGANSNFSLLGLEARGGEMTPMTLFTIALFISFGLSAYGLLFGRDWGMSACLATGYVGLVITVLVTIAGFASGMLTVRLEPLIQVPYLIKLHKIKPDWNGQETAQSAQQV